MPRPAAAPVLAAAAVVLAGTSVACEKPSPYVTLFANDRTVKARATSYCHEPGECRTDEGNLAVFRMKGRHEIGIDVPGEVAESGWRILELQGDSVSHERYRRLPPLQFEPGQPPQALTVVELDGRGEVKGRWQFEIRGI
jgi:hypothetical protein